MKTALVFLGLIAYATAAVPAASQRGVADVATDAIYKLAAQMPCGFPSLGIPPLAPLKIAYLDVNIDLPDFKLAGAIQDFRLNGLNNLIVNEMDINVVTSKVAFELSFPDISVETLYDLSVWLKKAGFTINMIGDGPALFAIKGLTITGSLKYNFSVLNGRMQIKSLDIGTHIDSVVSDVKGILGDGNVNARLNHIIERVVDWVVNDHSGVITQFVDAHALPAVNAALDNVSLPDLVASAGGTGDKAPCTA